MRGFVSPHGARFAVAQDAKRDDPCRATIRNLLVWGMSVNLVSRSVPGTFSAEPWREVTERVAPAAMLFGRCAVICIFLCPQQRPPLDLMARGRPGVAHSNTWHLDGENFWTQAHNGACKPTFLKKSEVHDLSAEFYGNCHFDPDLSYDRLRSLVVENYRDKLRSSGSR
jgi:hypothetical protein